MSSKGPIKRLDSVQGSGFLTIQAAGKVLDRHAPDLSRYTVLVVREGQAVSVIFADDAADMGTRKNFGVRPGASVEMNADDLSGLMTKLDEVTVLEKIQGSSPRSIRVAEGVFASRLPNRDLAQYKIDVVRDGDSVVVIFADKDRQPGTRGHNAQRPGFEVELDGRDLKVLRSNFTR